MLLHSLDYSTLDPYLIMLSVKQGSIKYHLLGGARGVMLSSQDMDTAIRVQILDLTDCISYSTNTLGKGMNPNILPPAMGK